ncbi:MAG: hypothetical protein ACRDSJ_20255 [Rubrobacteraceae bacterium]
MIHLPDTTSKAPRKRWPDFVLLGIGIVAIALMATAFLRGQDFSPGEEIRSENVEEVAASLEDTLYPPRDILIFDGRSEIVHVYLAVRDLDPEARVEARVERVGHGSPIARLFGSGGGIRVVEADEEQLAPSEEGVSGVVKFEVREAEGGRLPTGNYEVVVTVDGREAAVKRFVIQN